MASHFTRVKSKCSHWPARSLCCSAISMTSTPKSMTFTLWVPVTLASLLSPKYAKDILPWALCSSPACLYTAHHLTLSRSLFKCHFPKHIFPDCPPSRAFPYFHSFLYLLSCNTCHIYIYIYISFLALFSLLECKLY